MTEAKSKVAILMGSKSDWPSMKKARDILEELGVPSVAKVISAHRKPARLHEFIREAEKTGTSVFIAGAGMAAHLPGVIASMTTRPVLGVPMEGNAFDGMDALLSIVQMPPGIPVASLGVGAAGAKNAGLLAAEILAVSDPDLKEKLDAYRKRQAESLSEDPED